MRKNRTLVSFWTSRQENFCLDHLKLCFLWFDEILVEALGPHYKENFTDLLLNKDKLNKNELDIFTDIVAPLDSRVSNETIEAYNKSCPPGYPRWGKDCENFTYPDPENAEQYAHNTLLEYIMKEAGIQAPDGYGMQQIEGRARVAVDAVKLWSYVNTELPCIMQAGNDEKIAISSSHKFNRETSVKIEPFKVLEMSIPSLRKVSWKNIIKLKKEGNFELLRKKISEVSVSCKGDYGNATIALSRCEENTMSEIIERYRPNVKKVAIESTISNIPCIPIINPAGVYLGLKAVKEEYEKASELNWFYLLRDIKQLADNEN